MNLTLEDLPDDVLLYFLTSLRASNETSISASDLTTDFKTLASLNLASTQLNKLSTPILWSELPLTLARLGWFLDLLEERPILRAHVRRVVSGMNGNIRGRSYTPKEVSDSKESLSGYWIEEDAP